VVVRQAALKPGMIVRVPWGIDFVAGTILDVYGPEDDLRLVVRIPVLADDAEDHGEEISVPASLVTAVSNTWPRDSYTGPGGGLYTGPGGGLYTGPGGGAYTGPGGGLYTGPGGGAYTGPGGGLYTGPGGGLYTGPGGGLYTGPGGGLYTGPGGGLYTGPGGGLYTGPCAQPYRSNQPPRRTFLAYLTKHKMRDALKVLQDAWGLAIG
jgi:hypothetical protein